MGEGSRAVAHWVGRLSCWPWFDLQYPILSLGPSGVISNSEAGVTSERCKVWPKNKQKFLKVREIVQGLRHLPCLDPSLDPSSIPGTTYASLSPSRRNSWVSPSVAPKHLTLFWRCLGGPYPEMPDLHSGITPDGAVALIPIPSLFKDSLKSSSEARHHVLARKVPVSRGWKHSSPIERREKFLPFGKPSSLRECAEGSKSAFRRTGVGGSRQQPVAFASSQVRAGGFDLFFILSFPQ